MRRETKKTTYWMFALALFAAVLLLPETRAFASGAPKAEHIRTKQTEKIRITFQEGDYKVSGLKSSGKNLAVKATTVESSSEKTSDQETPWGYAEISMYAKKKGKYTVSFQVEDLKGNARRSYSVKVYANDEEAVKSASLNGNPFIYSIMTSKAKGKFKVSMNKGYKLKSIVMTTYDKKGNPQNKKIKNEKSAALGKYRAKRRQTSGDSNSYYDVWDADMMAETIFTVTYTDKYTKAAKTQEYTVLTIPKN